MQMETELPAIPIARILLGINLLANLLGKVLEITRWRPIGRGVLGNILQKISHNRERLVIILTRQAAISLIRSYYNL